MTLVLCSGSFGVTVPLSISLGVAGDSVEREQMSIIFSSVQMTRQLLLHVCRRSSGMGVLVFHYSYFITLTETFSGASVRDAFEISNPWNYGRNSTASSMEREIQTHQRSVR